MTALAADRNTPRKENDLKYGGVAASVQIFAGAIVMRNASGYFTKGQTATSLVGVGRAEENVLGGGNAGDVNMKVRAGTFKYGNSTSTDQLTIADIGKVCYVVDDQTVAKTNGSTTRSPAGLVDAIDPDGSVWVRFDEALLQAYLT